MEEQKTKIEGWRKIGIGMGAITALSLKDTMDFKIAVIIGFIAIVGIVCQGILDWRKKN
ncbi:hypothetical protein LCGC14_0400420 [marine sediment metagenome]|uniref:Uncharacterized protein n=1 Tax=marine sediment metagenome TaxID=412755 RepID=A0A0F9TF47_9ZZZZ